MYSSRHLFTFVLVLLGLSACDSATTPDGGMGDAGPVVVDGGARGSDGGAVSDAGAMSDAGTTGSVIDEWLVAISAMEAQYCRCGFDLMEYSSADECTSAHSIGPEPRGCAARVYGPFEAELGASTRCSTMVLADFAACMSAVADCDADALNACEMARATAGGMCTDAPPMRLEALFHEIGECAVGTAGTCPLAEVAAGTVGAGVWTGNTFEQGDDHLLSCAEGHGAPDVAFGWTAPAAGTYRFDTFGSSFDTTLAVLDGCRGMELACSEDAGQRRTSQLSVSLMEGQSVIVVIDGFNELANGAAILNVTAE